MINNFLEERAEKILESSGYFSVPVDVINLVKHLKINIEELELEDDVSGFLALDGDKTYIGYNISQRPERKRFTVAHELAHYYLHAKKETPLFIDKLQKSEPQRMYRDSKSSTGEYVREIEANAFAAALLMPKTLIENELNNFTAEDPEVWVSKLAEKFEVSKQAMNIRLINLDIISYII
jgi:Zn-dependent peptidase ImmA (M78 family)